MNLKDALLEKENGSYQIEKSTPVYTSSYGMGGYSEKNRFEIEKKDDKINLVSFYAWNESTNKEIKYEKEMVEKNFYELLESEVENIKVLSFSKAKEPLEDFRIFSAQLESQIEKLKEVFNVDKVENIKKIPFETLDKLNNKEEILEILTDGEIEEYKKNGITIDNYLRHQCEIFNASYEYNDVLIRERENDKVDLYFENFSYNDLVELKGVSRKTAQELMENRIEKSLECYTALDNMYEIVEDILKNEKIEELNLELFYGMDTEFPKETLEIAVKKVEKCTFKRSDEGMFFETFEFEKGNLKKVDYPECIINFETSKKDYNYDITFKNEKITKKEKEEIKKEKLSEIVEFLEDNFDKKVKNMVEKKESFTKGENKKTDSGQVL